MGHAGADRSRGVVDERGLGGMEPRMRHPQPRGSRRKGVRRHPPQALLLTRLLLGPLAMGAGRAVGIERTLRPYPSPGGVRPRARLRRPAAAGTTYSVLGN